MAENKHPSLNCDEITEDSEDINFNVKEMTQRIKWFSINNNVDCIAIKTPKQCLRVGSIVLQHNKINYYQLILNRFGKRFNFGGDLKTKH